MKDSDLAVSRRRFLLASAGLAASVVVAPALLEALDRLGPRRLFVPAPPKFMLSKFSLANYNETYFSQEALRQLETALSMATRINDGNPLLWHAVDRDLRDGTMPRYRITRTA